MQRFFDCILYYTVYTVVIGYRTYHTPNLENSELFYLTRNLDAVNPDVSVHSEGDTAVQNGGVKTMWLLQYRKYGTILAQI
jgi:hypothetical protein